MRAILLTFSVLVLMMVTSCSKENIKSGPEFPITKSGTLNFEYNFDYTNPTPPPSDTLQLKTIQNVNINIASYTAFYYLNDTSDFYIHDKKTGRITYNFLPVRYEDGNYYEIIENYPFIGKREVLVLKDDLTVGEIWSDTIYSERDDETTVYLFEVQDKLATYSPGQFTFQDVYKIRQLIKSPDSNTNPSDDAISFHYYNKDFGIIRKEIPPYQSGTYGTVIFNRLIY